MGVYRHRSSRAQRWSNHRRLRRLSTTRPPRSGGLHARAGPDQAVARFVERTNKTWFITGTSRGFGREWAIAALKRGDRVAGTARDPSTLDDVVGEDGGARLALEV